jgi:hypothetical protein
VVEPVGETEAIDVALHLAFVHFEKEGEPSMKAVLATAILALISLAGAETPTTLTVPFVSEDWKLGEVQQCVGFIGERLWCGPFATSYIIQSFLEGNRHADSLPTRKYRAEFRSKGRHQQTQGACIKGAKIPEVYAWDCRRTVDGVICEFPQQETHHD